MSDETVTALDVFAAPYGREVTLENVEYESGMHLLRIRIREGHRFTILNLDESTAAHWGKAMSEWAGNLGSISNE